MRVNETLVRLMVTIDHWQRSALVRPGDDPDRGDVPGWVFVTMMSAALVGVLWAVAGTELERLLSEALANVIP